MTYVRIPLPAFNLAIIAFAFVVFAVAVFCALSGAIFGIGINKGILITICGAVVVI